MGGVLEVARDTERGEVVIRRVVDGGDPEVVRALRADDTDAVHLELVPLRLAAEHGVVVEQETAAVGSQALEVVRGRQPREPAADDHDVVRLVGHGRVAERGRVAGVPKPMRGPHEIGSVPVRARVVPYPAGAVPLGSERVGKRLRGRRAVSGRDAAPVLDTIGPATGEGTRTEAGGRQPGTHETGTAERDEVAAGDVAVHSEPAVTLVHAVPAAQGRPADAAGAACPLTASSRPPPGARPRCRTAARRGRRTPSRRRSRPPTAAA